MNIRSAETRESAADTASERAELVVVLAKFAVERGGAERAQPNPVMDPQDLPPEGLHVPTTSVSGTLTRKSRCSPEKSLKKIRSRASPPVSSVCHRP